MWNYWIIFLSHLELLLEPCLLAQYKANNKKRNGRLFKSNSINILNGFLMDLNKWWTRFFANYKLFHFFISLIFFIGIFLCFSLLFMMYLWFKYLPKISNKNTCKKFSFNFHWTKFPQTEPNLVYLAWIYLAVNSAKRIIRGKLFAIARISTVCCGVWWPCFRLVQQQTFILFIMCIPLF